MSNLVASNGFNAAVRVALAGLTLALLSGCSSDVTRFSSPFSNPFGPTASATDTTPTSDIVPRAAMQPVITSKALAAPAGQAAQFNNNSPSQMSQLAAPAKPAPVLAHAKPVVEPMTTASINKHPVSALGGWSSAGGTPIVVATGESVAMLSTRYGVPQNVLLSVNGFTSAAQVQPGARLVIPVYNSNGAPSAEAAPETVAPKAQATAKFKLVRGAQPAETATKHAESPQLAKADKAKQELALAKAKKHDLAANHGKAPVNEAAAKPDAAHHGAMLAKTATAKPVQVAVAASPVKAAAKPSATEVDQTPTASLAPDAPKAEPETTTAYAETNPEFRWPARGRIIQGFKSGGNDGINIAVPEGTSVKAAEGGVVAYAGSELKGYGNLILIRHPNGFVSAYANNGELIVKRGEQVKRGQIIAKSGQTGNVSSPQLHFELRKGSTPVDPTNYLAGL